VDTKWIRSQLNGSKWRGGVLNIALAKPDFKERLEEEAAAEEEHAADASVTLAGAVADEAAGRYEIHVRLPSGQLVLSAPGVVIGSRRIVFPSRRELPLLECLQAAQQGLEPASRLQDENARLDAACDKRQRAPPLDPGLFDRSSHRLGTVCPDRGLGPVQPRWIPRTCWWVARLVLHCLLVCSALPCFSFDGHHSRVCEREVTF
jgi:hypothetical protein